MTTNGVVWWVGHSGSHRVPSYLLWWMLRWSTAVSDSSGMGLGPSVPLELGTGMRRISMVFNRIYLNPFDGPGAPQRRHGVRWAAEEWPPPFIYPNSSAISWWLWTLQRGKRSKDISRWWNRAADRLAAARSWRASRERHGVRWES